MTPVLHTPRLTLRPRGPDDAEALFATMSDPEAMRWWSHPPCASVDALRIRFADDHPDWRNWAVARRDDERAIGFVAAGVRRPGVSEIGYLFARDTWGQGIAIEGLTALLTQLFAEGTRRVFADIDPDNAPSIRLVRRLGFVLEGRLRAEWETHIGVRDTVIYGLLRDEWPAGGRPA